MNEAPEPAPQEQEVPPTVTIPQEQWDALQQELKESRDKHLRLLADMENLRKRMIKERDEHSHHLVANVVCDFLHPMDNLENALNFAHQMSDEVRNWAIGFQMVLTQFKDVLTAHGVTPVDSTGTTFDPHQHEAVEAVESETHAPGTVIEEYVKGYKMGPRTIRPARVKVSRGTTTKGDKEEEAFPLTNDKPDEEKFIL